MKSADKFPQRLHRLDWLFQNVEPLYFVTFNAYKHRRVLAQPDVHDAFRLFCQCAQDRDVAVGRYVIMPDHIHLFVWLPPIGITLEQWIKALRTVIGKTLLTLGICKPHWQEGFFDHVLRSSESYSEKWEYVRMNPVRAGLSSTPEGWPYQGEILTLPFA